MDLNRIIQQTHIITNDIIKCAKQMCVNKFPSKIFYIKVLADDINCYINIYERQKRMLEVLTQEPLLDELAIALEIHKQQQNLCWIDFELYHTSIVTIIMTTFINKENNKEDLQFHSCFALPVWADKTFDIKHIKGNFLKRITYNIQHKRYLKKGKFDINWKHKSLYARWKLLIWEITFVRQRL